MARPTILIAVDAGRRTLDAVRLGELLARVSGAPVALASAFPDVPLDGEVERRMRDEARETLLALGATLDGVEVTEARVVEALSVPRALQRLTEEEGAGLVVIGSSHRGPVGRVVPGTIAERLLAGAASPVAVAPAGYAEAAPDALRTIAAGYDGSPESALALDAAAGLARAAGATLRVVTVTGGDAAALPALDGVAVEHEVTDGDAAEVLAARSAAVDLLVTGSRGYGPLGAVLLGGTTHRLLGAVACPLLVTPRGASLRLSA